MPTLLTGPAIIEGALVSDAALLIEADRIVYAGPRADLPADASITETIAHDGYILPGLVDIHNHGGGGWSFPDTEHPGDAAAAINEHRRHGTTSIVASLVTAPQDVLVSRVRALAALCDAGELAGIHLEGPFISVARKGAHDPDFIVPGDAERTRALIAEGRGHVVTMTVAPEADPDGAVSRALIQGRALPSYGHTDCSGEQFLEAVEGALHAIEAQDGAALSPRPTATHLFNAMRPIHHRDAGPALAAIDAASRSELVVELIADGVHTSADTVKYVCDLVPADALMFITDAMAATGMADGSYVLGSLDVTVAGGVATLTHGGNIAGGTAHLIDVVRFAHLEAGVDLARAVHAASQVPATVLGIQADVGALAEGRLADILLVTSDLSPVRVMRRGAWLDA
ncbi:MAG: amidohydrolase family protein [Dermabacter sp.]|nr:amidohydrolase family protein [Dermabacter sp.]